MQPTIHEPRVVDDAIKLIQEHLDREARNRRQTALEPRDLCPMQRARLVSDLQNALDPNGGSLSVSRQFRQFFGTIMSAFRGRP